MPMNNPKNVCVSGVPHEILASLEDVFDSLDPSTRLEVIVGDALSGSGTRAQKALYWIWLGELSTDCGYTVKELDVLLRDLFLAPVVIEEGGARQKTISEMTKNEMMGLLDQLSRWAEDMFGIRLTAKPKDTNPIRQGVMG